MTAVVSEILRGATPVSDLLNGALNVVVPDSVGACSLLGHVLCLEPSVAVVSQRCRLISAAAFSARILDCLLYLITHVIGVDCSGVNTTALPVEQLSLDRAPQHVRIDPLLPPFRHTRVKRAFVGERYYFTAGTTAACITGFLRCPVRISSN